MTYAHNAAALEFDSAFDGAYVHRVVARRLDGPSVVGTRDERSTSSSVDI